jgi:hypothetical protein
MQSHENLILTRPGQGDHSAGGILQRRRGERRNLQFQYKFMNLSGPGASTMKNKGASATLFHLSKI